MGFERSRNNENKWLKKYLIFYESQGKRGRREGVEGQDVRGSPREEERQVAVLLISAIKPGLSPSQRFLPTTIVESPIECITRESMTRIIGTSWL